MKVNRMRTLLFGGELNLNGMNVPYNGGGACELDEDGSIHFLHFVPNLIRKDWLLFSRADYEVGIYWRAPLLVIAERFIAPKGDRDLIVDCPFCGSLYTDKREVRGNPSIASHLVNVDRRRQSAMRAAMYIPYEGEPNLTKVMNDAMAFQREHGISRTETAKLYGEFCRKYPSGEIAWTAMTHKWAFGEPLPA